MPLEWANDEGLWKEEAAIELFASEVSANCASP